VDLSAFFIRPRGAAVGACALVLLKAASLAKRQHDICAELLASIGASPL